ncbi:MAG TPA: dihydrofolate reductase family protein [Dehalococcoidia bacterium]|nr:dihydrofolate reductase family protein [Dehalococcoidia bacterium]
MRKIVAGLFMSLDGVIGSPDKWSFPYFDEEMGQAVGGLIAASDTLLLGRVTYEEFAAAFAGDTSGNPDAAQMNGIAKVVVSTTLKQADWQNSTLLNGDVAEGIARLKQQPGQSIGMSGSNTLLRWLLRRGLLDELHLLVVPVVVGSGKRLIEGEGEQLPLKLTASATHGNGVLHLTYEPV